jgi:hypothetical protein
MFRIPNIVLKDTLVVESLGFESIPLVEFVKFKFVPLTKLVDTTSEKHVANLVASVK